MIEPETPVYEDTPSSVAEETNDTNSKTPTDDAVAQTITTEGKTESIFINPLFYIAIAIGLLVIVFVVFTVIKKKK